MLAAARNCTIQDIASALQTPFPVTARAPVSPSRAQLVARGDYLPALTGLRFWLAVWVILHHICGPGMLLEAWANGLPGPVLQLIRGGYLAVQTFFVLSGFVLARTYARAKWNRRGLARFFTARFARIYPVYFISLILLSPFIIEMLLSPVWKARRVSLLTIYLLVLQGWTAPLGVGWNTPAWSLSCEFFFYLWFPVVLVLLRNARWRVISVVMVLAIMTPVALDHAGVPWIWKPVYNLPGFVAGIAAARIFALLDGSSWTAKRGYWLYVPALALGGWLIIHPAVINGSGADINTYLIPLNVALLIGFALSGGWIAGWLSTRPAAFLGKASYSMYVLHVPILWWTGRYLMQGGMHLPGPVGAAIYLTLVVGTSGLIFKWLEAPASVWIRAQGKIMEPR